MNRIWLANFPLLARVVRRSQHGVVSGLPRVVERGEVVLGLGLHSNAQRIRCCRNDSIRPELVH